MSLIVSFLIFGSIGMLIWNQRLQSKWNELARQRFILNENRIAELEKRKP